MRLWPVISERAMMFGRYPSASAAFLTFSAVFFDTDVPGVK